MDLMLLTDGLQKDGARWETKLQSLPWRVRLLSPAIGALSVSFSRFAANPPQNFPLISILRFLKKKIDFWLKPVCGGWNLMDVDAANVRESPAVARVL